jgi:ATP-dependent DNA helicase RecG
MADRSISTEVQYLKGVGPKHARTLEKLNIRTVEDLLMHIPRRYEDRRHLPPISQARSGEFVTIKGRVTNVDARPTRGGMVILKAMVRDSSGGIVLTWFNQPWIKRQLETYKGEIIAYGQVKETSGGREISGPEFEILGPEDDPEDFARIVPVYPSTEGLPQKVLRRAARAATEGYVSSIDDPLPEALRKQLALRELVWALRETHLPNNEQNRLEARKRLVFDEFFTMQLGLAMRRAEVEEELGISFPISRLIEGAQLPVDRPVSTKNPAVQDRRPTESHLFADQDTKNLHDRPLWDQIHDLLPFDLTGAQRRVIGEIFRDMERPHPMNRLVQGDVGSGKTAVAACAMLAAVRSGYQAALMAPTEILAEQHYINLRRLFDPLGIEVELLVGKLTQTQKKKAAENTELGRAHIAVGTHALIQEGVKFANLGLVVVDEQHRFGVLQRMALREKGLGSPDVLVMTATPIPRTLTMVVYGDLDVSIIDELPPGRRPVKTHWKQPCDRESTYTAIRKLIDEGRQAYIVCPLVGESEKLVAQAAEDLHYRLVNGEFADKNVGLLHGQMKPKDKEATMERFRKGEIDILVSTTVIEVGVDVPNASIMVIEDANRFGLSQLHQLRGRVGRGAHQSFCILLADAKNEVARERLEVMVSTTDGFKIAEEDLKLRGPGELAGTKQHGNLDFKIADLIQDANMLEVAREAAIRVIEVDPHLESSEHLLLKQRVRRLPGSAAMVTVS